MGIKLTLPQAPREQYPDNCSVFVGQLPEDCTPEELYEHFQLCGEVKRITIKVNRETGARMGFAYIDFEVATSAEDAQVLDGSTFKGQPIKVNKKRPRDEGFGFGFGGKK